MNWAEKKVLVTGAGGFIGSHLAEALVARGARVRAFLHYNALGRWGWLDRSDLANEMEVVLGDITDAESVLRAAQGVETVFHLAALIGIPYSYHAAYSYVQTNIIGTLNVLQAAKKLDVGRVVHTSTSEVYGTADYIPIDEGHPLKGQSPYSASKIGADKMVEAFNRSFEVQVVTVRPFNTFGPRQSARAIVPTIIVQALVGEKVVLGNLDPTRDLNYVDNTVDGFLRAGAAEEAVGKTVNLGSGREVSIAELCGLIEKLLGKAVEIETDPVRVRPAESEVDRLLADNLLALELLGWKPEVELCDGLTRTIEWISNNLEYYRALNYAI